MRGSRQAGHQLPNDRAPLTHPRTGSFVRVNRYNGGIPIVSPTVTRFRALLVAIAVLALSAGAALAGHSALTTPSAAADGLQRAAEAAGKTVPVAGPPAEAPVEDADENTDEDADEDTEEAKPADEAPVDAAADHPDNHGKAVSEAAQATTPDGFDNHGQYVKTIATDNHGQEVAAEHAPADVSKGKPRR